MILSRDFIIYYIQKYFTKSINYTYLLSYFYCFIFPIYQTLFIYY